MSIVTALRRTLWAVLLLVVAFGVACAWDATFTPDEPPGDLFGPGFHRTFILAGAMLLGIFGGLPAGALLLALRLRRRWVSAVALLAVAAIFVGLCAVTVTDGWDEAYGRLGGLAVLAAVLATCLHPAVRGELRL